MYEFGLLGYILGRIQKTTFQTLLKEKIFSKYEMNHSYTSSKDLGKQLVKGLDKNGAIVSNWDFDTLFGAGGILSTSADLVHFAQAQFEPKNNALALTRVPTYDIDNRVQIGLGWHIAQSPKGKKYHFHSGGTGGYSSLMMVDVENQTAVIILSNVFDMNTSIDALGHQLIESI